jgi:hypothetical protein
MIHLLEAKTAKPSGNRTARRMVVGMYDRPPGLSAAEMRGAGRPRMVRPPG